MKSSNQTPVMKHINKTNRLWHLLLVSAATLFVLALPTMAQPTITRATTLSSEDGAAADGTNDVSLTATENTERPLRTGQSVRRYSSYMLTGDVLSKYATIGGGANSYEVTPDTKGKGLWQHWNTSSWPISNSYQPFVSAIVLTAGDTVTFLIYDDHVTEGDADRPTLTLKARNSSGTVSTGSVVLKLTINAKNNNHKPRIFPKLTYIPHTGWHPDEGKYTISTTSNEYTLGDLAYIMDPDPSGDTDAATYYLRRYQTNQTAYYKLQYKKGTAAWADVPRDSDVEGLVPTDKLRAQFHSNVDWNVLYQANPTESVHQYILRAKEGDVVSTQVAKINLDLDAPPHITAGGKVKPPYILPSTSEQCGYKMNLSNIIGKVQNIPAATNHIVAKAINKDRGKWQYLHYTYVDAGNVTREVWADVPTSYQQTDTDHHLDRATGKVRYCAKAGAHPTPTLGDRPRLEFKAYAKGEPLSPAKVEVTAYLYNTRPTYTLKSTIPALYVTAGGFTTNLRPNQFVTISDIQSNDQKGILITGAHPGTPAAGTWKLHGRGKGRSVLIIPPDRGIIVAEGTAITFDSNGKVFSLGGSSRPSLTFRPIAQPDLNTLDKESILLSNFDSQDAPNGAGQLGATTQILRFDLTTVLPFALSLTSTPDSEGNLPPIEETSAGGNGYGLYQLVSANRTTGVLYGLETNTAGKGVWQARANSNSAWAPFISGAGYPNTRLVRFVPSSSGGHTYEGGHPTLTITGVHSEGTSSVTVKVQISPRPTITQVIAASHLTWKEDSISVPVGNDTKGPLLPALVRGLALRHIATVSNPDPALRSGLSYKITSANDQGKGTWEIESYVGSNGTPVSRPLANGTSLSVVLTADSALRYRPHPDAVAQGSQRPTISLDVHRSSGPGALVPLNLTVAITPVEDAPRVTEVTTTATITEDVADASNVGDRLSSYVTISDPDGGTSVRYRVVPDSLGLAPVSVNAKGQWQYKKAGTSEAGTWSPLPGTGLNTLEAVDSVRFVPHPNYHTDWTGNENRPLPYLEVSAYDAEKSTDLQNSKDTVRVSISVTAVDDPPVLTAVGSHVSQEGTTTPQGVGVGVLGAVLHPYESNGTTATTNNNGRLISAVSDGSTDKGTWKYQTETDGTWTEITLSTGQVLPLDEDDTVRFEPTNATTNTSGLTWDQLPSLTVHAWDKSVTTGSPTAGTAIALSSLGTTAYSATGNKWRWVVNASGNNAPTITASKATLARSVRKNISDADNAGYALSGLATIADSDAGATLTYQLLSINERNRGVWQYQTSGQTEWTTLTQSAIPLVGLVAADKLRFKPKHNATTSDDKGVEKDALKPWVKLRGFDGQLGTDVKYLSLTIKDVNTAPAITAATNNVSIVENNTTHAGYTLSSIATISDVDNDLTTYKVTAADAQSKGAWEHKVMAADDWSALPTPPVTGLATTSLVRFVPTANTNTSDGNKPTLTLKANDGESDSDNQVVLTLAVKALPTITAVTTALTLEEDQAHPKEDHKGNVGHKLSEIATVADADTDDSPTYHVTPNAQSKGTWQYQDVSAQSPAWADLTELKTDLVAADSVRFKLDDNANTGDDNKPTLELRAYVSADEISLASTKVTLTLTITPVTDLPTITATSTTTITIDEDASPNEGAHLSTYATVAAGEGGTVGYELTGTKGSAGVSNPSLGAWQYRDISQQNPTWVDVPQSGVSPLAANDSVRFVPGQDLNTELTDAVKPILTLKAIEGSNKSEGTGVSVTLTITAVDDAPVIADNNKEFPVDQPATGVTADPDGLAVSEIGTATHAAGETPVAADLGRVVTAIDNQGDDGKWQYHTGSGNWTDISLTGSQGVLLLKDDSVRYVPAADATLSGTAPTLTVKAWAWTGDNPTVGVQDLPTGTAISTGTATLTANINPSGNNRPTIAEAAGAGKGLSRTIVEDVTETNNAGYRLGDIATLSDEDASDVQNLTYKITASAAHSKGTWQHKRATGGAWADLTTPKASLTVDSLVRLVPNADANTADDNKPTLTLKANDSKVDSEGSVTFELTITPVEDKPTIAAISGALEPTINEDELTNGTRLAAYATVADPDSETAPHYHVVPTNQGKGVWQYKGSGGTVWKDIPTTGINTLTGDTLVRLKPNPDANTLGHTSENPTKPTLALKAYVGSKATANQESDETVTVTLTITAVEDKPRIALAQGAPTLIKAIGEDPTPSKALSDHATVSDPDSDTAPKYKVVANNQDKGSWEYKIGSGNWTPVPSGGLNTLVANDSVRFDPNQGATTGTDDRPTLTLHAYVSTKTSANQESETSVVLSVSIKATNTAPTITSLKTTETIPQDIADAANVGKALSTYARVGDTDTDDTPTYKVTASNEDKGAWQYKVGTGAWTAVPDAGINTLVAANTVRFKPNAGANTGTGTKPTLTLKAYDGTDESSASVVVTLTITPATSPNTAPTITSLKTTETIAQDITDAANVGKALSTYARVADEDAGDTPKYKVTATNQDKGAWQYRVGTGAWTAVPTAGINTLVAADKVRFKPNTGANTGTGTKPTLTLKAYDGTDESSASVVVTLTITPKSTLSAPLRPDLRLYPNPTDGLLHVSGVRASDKLRLLNVNGQVVHEGEASSAHIELSHLPSGVYVVEIVGEGGVSRHTLLVE